MNAKQAMKHTSILLVVLFIGKSLLAVDLATWDSQREAERNCISAARYGIEDKCYSCKGTGYLKRSKYVGKPIPGKRGRPKVEYFVQCANCLKKKDKWEKLQQEQERRSVLATESLAQELDEERRKWNEEQEKKQEEKQRLEAEKKKRLDDASQNVYNAEVNVELQRRIEEEMHPERLCEIHKWKECYAPIFGGDYYTADAKAKYAQNYMKALELQEKGVLKYMCHDNGRQQRWRAQKTKVCEAMVKLDEAVKKKKEAAKELKEE